MVVYHGLAWGISLIIIMTVAITNHEGHSSNDDNMQWCWVVGEGRSQQFIWELVGGKLVEWSSCIYISVIYILILHKLYQMNTNSHLSISQSSSGPRRYVPAVLPAPSSSHLSLEEEEEEEEEVEGDPFIREYVSEVSSIPDPTDVLSNKYHTDDEDSEQVNIYMNTQLNTSNSPVHTYTTTHTGATNTYEHSQNQQITSNASNYFNKFFVQMSIVPFLFFFTRFWGSLRMLLQYTHPDLVNQRLIFVIYMQAIFDPAQGFSNFILFVLTSEEEKHTMMRSFLSGANYVRIRCNVYGSRYVPGYEFISTVGCKILFGIIFLCNYIAKYCCCGAKCIDTERVWLDRPVSEVSTMHKVVGGYYDSGLYQTTPTNNESIDVSISDASEVLAVFPPSSSNSVSGGYEPPRVPGGNNSITAL